MVTKNQLTLFKSPTYFSRSNCCIIFLYFILILPFIEKKSFCKIDIVQSTPGYHWTGCSLTIYPSIFVHNQDSVCREKARGLSRGQNEEGYARKLCISVSAHDLLSSTLTVGLQFPCFTDNSELVLFLVLPNDGVFCPKSLLCLQFLT